jgi:hypothetical protein
MAFHAAACGFDTGNRLGDDVGMEVAKAAICWMSLRTDPAAVEIVTEK